MIVRTRAMQSTRLDFARHAKRGAAIALVALTGCAVMPTGPSQLVLPGTGKSFEQFRYDDAECRQFAFDQSGGRSAEQAAVDSGVRSAAIGAAVGALAGAAIGGGRGAGVGAGAGLLFGSAAGAGAAETSSWGMQRRYDQGFQQCMYAKGHRVPVSGRFSVVEPRRTVTAIPSPPGGAPPAPPTSAGASPAPPASAGTPSVPPPPPPGAPPAPPSGTLAPRAG